jgi:sugar phosphate isomerase/epimerase
MMADLSRLSLNQKTIDQWSVAEAVAACRRAGIDWIGLWREPVADLGLSRAAALVRDAGMRVSTLCRGGFFATDDPQERARRANDNRSAVDEAVALGTDVLVLVCGGIAGGGTAGADLERSREQVTEGIADLVPYAADRGVRLGIEPLHPVFCADRSVIVTLAQALDVAEQFSPDVVGVVVDTFHLWWDPGVWPQISRAAGRIVSYQVCDWLVPLPDPLLGRGLPGDGPIDFARFGAAVAAAGYDGPIEVEIFNADIWRRNGDAVLNDVIERFRTHVA